MSIDWTKYEQLLDGRLPSFGVRAVGFIDEAGKMGVDWYMDYDEGGVPVYQVVGMLQAIQHEILTEADEAVEP